LRRISGLRGKALPNNHLHIPKIERKSNNTEREIRKSDLVEKKIEERKSGCHKSTPLKESRPRDYRAYLLAKRTYLCVTPQINQMSCFHRFTLLLTVSSDGSGAVFSNSCIESLSFLSGIPFVLVVCCLGSVGSE
jgi:hypothetical protein